MKQDIIIKKYMSPCGMLVLGDFDGQLCLCDWQESGHREITDHRLNRFLNAGSISGTTDVIEQAISQLEEFFDGKRRYFDIPLLTVGTDFQKKVWHRLMSIDYGQTVSYGDIAMSMNMESATRAVANAIGANAISIFVPCHRVVGKTGNLTGYAGGINAKSLFSKSRAKKIG